MEAVTSMSRLQAEVRVMSARVQDHALFRELSLSRQRLDGYQQLLWALRQVHLGAEGQLEVARHPVLRKVRLAYQRKVPFLERDLVAACGKRLEVDRQVNARLDDLLHALSRPTTPARILGRLMLIEALLAGHALPLSGFAASPQLPGNAGGYLGLCSDAAHYAECCALFAEGLHGEVPQTNAMQAATELAAALEAALDAIVAVTVGARSAPTRERSA